MINILKLACLFMGIWFTLINTSNTFLKDNVPAANYFCQALGITGFVYLQWII